MNTSYKTTINVNDLKQVYELLETTEQQRQSTFIYCLRELLSEDDIKQIKEKGIPDEIRISKELMDKIYDTEVNRVIEHPIVTALNNQSIIKGIQIKVDEFLKEMNSEIVFVWYPKISAMDINTNEMRDLGFINRYGFNVPK